MSEDFVILDDIINHLSMKALFLPDVSCKGIKIISRHINRMGLDLIGTLSEFDKNRILIMGESERLFLSRLEPNEIKKSIGTILSLKPPVLFVTKNIEIQHEVIEMAEKHSIPVFITEDRTSDFISDLTEFLNEFLAPKITRSAGLVSIHGEGVLIIGESGIGKSEIELELISRGHKFVSDDITEIKKFSARTLQGSSPQNVSKFIEVRGVGIVNVQDLFGINAIKNSEKIDMVVNLELWKDGKKYSRLGDEEKYIEILDVKIPYISIPVKSGKNISVVIEVAAMNNRLKKFGGDPYAELMSQLGIKDIPKSKSPEKIKCIWDV